MGLNLNEQEPKRNSNSVNATCGYISGDAHTANSSDVMFLKIGGMSGDPASSKILGREIGSGRGFPFELI